MSHIAEVYAKDLGVKIGKPELTEHYFPICFKKYITFQNPIKMQAQQYDYWDIVFDLVKPHLNKKGIKVVQVGGPQEKAGKHVDHFIPTSFKQMNYVIKNAMMHVGVDSLPGHVASAYDIPSVILHFNLLKENSKPLWNKKSKCISIEPNFDKYKPSYMMEENPKRINDINPEDIAQNILNQLNIDAKIEFKTIRKGAVFQNLSLEIVPDFFGFSDSLKGKNINLRADLHYDLNNIVNWGKHYQLCLFLKQEIPPDALSFIKNNVKQIVFKLNDLEYDYTNFFKFIKKNKINLILLTENEDNISELRLKYFDFPVIPEPKPKEEDVKSLITDNTKFCSNKSFVSKGETFYSESSAKRLDKTNSFKYSEDSLKEIESLYLYE